MNNAHVCALDKIQQTSSQGCGSFLRHFSFCGFVLEKTRPLVLIALDNYTVSIDVGTSQYKQRKPGLACYFQI